MTPAELALHAVIVISTGLCALTVWLLKLAFNDVRQDLRELRESRDQHAVILREITVELRYLRREPAGQHGQ